MRTTFLTKVLATGGVGVLAAVPLMGVNQFWVFFLTVALVQAILLASLNLALGYAGLISLGHNAFYAIGGYATAYFSISMGVPAILSLPLGLAFGALAGMALALTTYRARAIYFGIISLAFLFVTFETVSKWPVLGGFRGFPNVPNLSVGSFSFGRNEYFWFALGVFVVAMAAVQQLSSSAVGRAFVAIRENEAAAASLGISPFGTKLVNLGVAGGLAGLAGALFAHLAGGIFPEAASFTNAVRLFVAIVVGGMGTFAGPLVGIGVISTVDRLTVNLTTAQPIIFSLMLLGFLAVMRLGIVGTVLTSRFRSLFLKMPELPMRLERDDTRPPEPLRASRCPLLEVSGLTKRFDGVLALDGVDLSVEAGSIHGLIGPNGSGKTTLVNCVTGVVRHDGGRLCLDGREVSRPRPHSMARAGVVRIFQHQETFGRLLAVQNVLVGLHLRSESHLLRCMLPLRRRRATERELVAEAMGLLETVGLSHRAMSSVGEIPYGEQRLLDIARAVAARPRLLILDEPATGLTAVELTRLAALLRSLRDEGVTILLIEHNMAFVMGLVDRITVLERGSVIAVGDPLGIQSDPQVIEAYLGEREVA